MKASCVLEDESMGQMGNISILAIRLRVAQNIFNLYLSTYFNWRLISLTYVKLIICGRQSNIIIVGMNVSFNLPNKNVGRCNILHRVLIKIQGVYYQELNIATFEAFIFFVKPACGLVNCLPNKESVINNYVEESF